MGEPTERVEGEAIIAIAEGAEAHDRTRRSFVVRVPGSTSNLGAGFDCFGLALQLYLRVRATVVPHARVSCRVRSHGVGAKEQGLPRTGDNLIFRAMQLAARREGLSLPPVRLAVHNELPLGGGLGSSAAAIVAGISLCALVCDQEFSSATILRYALEMEGHADNVAAALHGGRVVSCLTGDGNVLTVKRPWPPEVKIIVVSPHASMKTADARTALPRTVARDDAVFNLQRAALFGAALETGAYDLLWEAMQDRLHQAHRQSFVPGLTEVLAMPQQPGLVGLALSGSGPSVVALACDRFQEIGEKMANTFRRHGTPTTVRLLAVDDEGRRTEIVNRAAG